MSKLHQGAKEGLKWINSIRMLIIFMIFMIVVMGIGFLFPNPFLTLPKLVRQVDDSVVLINVDLGENNYYGYSFTYLKRGRHTKWLGSGVIISEDLILTAGHVVDFPELADVDVTVTLKDGTKLEVLDFYKVDSGITDVGILKVDPNGIRLKVVKFGTARVGEKVFAIGAPYGIFQYITSGIISALNVDDDFFGKKNLLMTDTPLNPGNSGCPLFNMRGEVVAMLVGNMHDSDGIGFCIPAKVCLAVIDIYNANKVLEAIEE